MKRLLLLATFFLFAQQLFAVIAYPYPITFTQPNGDTLTLIMRGDEFFNYAHSSDGYTLMYNNKGYFTYAQRNSYGDLEPSAFTAKSPNQRTRAEQKFLSSIPKRLRFSDAQLQQFNQIKNAANQKFTQSKGLPTLGDVKMVCFLMETPDRPFVRTKADFENLFNQLGYNYGGATGSVRDFFRECSYNALNLTTDILGPFTANHDMEYYVNRGYRLVEEGIAQADNDVDFSIYDNDNDGVVDGVFMIFSGHGQEAGGGSDCIWSHASYVSGTYADGVEFGRYACAPELRGASGSGITYIGVICHELGHSFGAPDYYDTDYEENGQCSGTGTWDLQGSGSWNNSGKTPAHPNPRSKIFTYNWAECTTLTTTQEITLPSSRLYKNAFYRINTNTNNEFFLIENRQLEGFDNNIPGHGMMIYHQHADINYWDINSQHPQQFYPVAANCQYSIPTHEGEYGSINSTSCSWPGTGHKTQITDSTTPSLRAWNGSNSGVQLLNISESNGTITFNFVADDTAETANYQVYLPTINGITYNATSNSTLVAAGEDFSFSFTLDEAYLQSQPIVKANNVVLTPIQGVYTIENIQMHQVVEISGISITTYQISASAGENGEISPEGVTTINYGYGKTYTITPEIGFAVNQVYIDSVSVGAMEEYTFTNVTENHTIYADFAAGDPTIIYTIPDELEFFANVGETSDFQNVMIHADDNRLKINLLATITGDFKISINGTNWGTRLVINKDDLPKRLFVKFEPTYAGERFDTLSIMSQGALTKIPVSATTNVNITENSLTNFNISPNPTEDYIQLSNLPEQLCNAMVIDAIGNVVMQFEITNNNKIDVSALPSGVYFLKITSESGTAVRKFVKR